MGALFKVSTIWGSVQLKMRGFFMVKLGVGFYERGWVEMSKFDHLNWMDQIYKEYENENDVTANPGFGKPLPKNIFSGDVYDNFVNTARNAGYLPEWIKLQKEIRAKLGDVIAILDKGESVEACKKEMKNINAIIKKYNLACPPSMQRAKIELVDVRTQYEVWS